MRALSIRVRGRVQGVFFRASTRDKANELGVCGWCQNEADGSVLIHAEAEEARLTQFLAWCHQGPRLAIVDQLKQEEKTPEGFLDFRIRR